MDNTADSSSHPFRNGTAGAEAKRQKLLRDRRDELATMSHEIRQIYVRRFSRLLASVALAIGGSIVVAASLDDELANSLAGLLPGSNPAALSTMLLATWLVAGFALFGGRAWAERRFAVAMSKAVLPTSELHTDVSRLGCEDPAMVGRAITRKLVPISRMVSILASGLVLPVSALAAYLVIKAGGYPLVDDVELLFAAQAGHLLLIACMAVLLSLRLAFAANWRPTFFTALGAAILLPGAFVVAPTYLPAVLGGCALLITTAYLNYRRRSKDDAKMDQEGAPVPPVLQFRKRVSQLWTALWSVTHLLRWSSWKAAGATVKRSTQRCLAFRPSFAQCMSVLVLAGAGVGMALVYAGEVHAGNDYQRSAFSGEDATDSANGDSPSSYSILSSFDESTNKGVRVEFTFVNGKAADATEHLSNAYIPPGWRATVTIEQLWSDGRLHVEALDQVDSGSITRQLGDDSPTVSFERSNCSGQDIPLLFNATPYGSWDKGSTTATLEYTVQMVMLGSCL